MYDYVIVGGGSAGCVLAARLSEDPAVSVLLLEAGRPDRKLRLGRRLEIRIPAAFPKLFKTEVDWNYSTEPEPQLNDRRLYWPRGKTLGGSSAINAMIYIRGHRLDYDQWRDLGNPGWGYHEVLPYFLRSEHQQRGASPYHSIGGQLPVSDLRTRNVLSEAFVVAGQQAGLPYQDDFNGDRQEGVGFYQVTQRRGMRASAAAAFLAPARRRANLTVRSCDQVRRVRIEQGRAVGVECLVDGRPTTLRAKREVVLSAGAVNSPQLLLLSGIGPADKLRALGIDVVADLPGVGRNLQDHPVVGLLWTTNTKDLKGADSVENLLTWLVRRRGPLTSNIAEAGGFFRTRPELPAPDLQLHFAPVLFLDAGLTPPPQHGYSIGVTLLTPGSRGSIQLRSADPTDKPRIQACYFTDPADLTTMVAGLRRAFEIGDAPALRAHRKTLFPPATAATDEGSLTRHVRSLAQTLYHPVGTCAMGPGPESVVDHTLQVHGLAGLRVVDASIMPVVPRGNTNAPTIMIAEKAADLIREH